MQKIIEHLRENEQILNKIILSDTKTETKKIIARKVTIKNQVKWQIERFIGAQVFHTNTDFNELLTLNFEDYKQK